MCSSYCLNRSLTIIGSRRRRIASSVDREESILNGRSSASSFQNHQSFPNQSAISVSGPSSTISSGCVSSFMSTSCRRASRSSLTVGRLRLRRISRRLSVNETSSSSASFPKMKWKADVAPSAQLRRARAKNEGSFRRAASASASAIARSSARFRSRTRKDAFSFPSPSLRSGSLEDAWPMVSL